MTSLDLCNQTSDVCACVSPGSLVAREAESRGTEHTHTILCAGLPLLSRTSKTVNWESEREYDFNI